MSRGKSQEDATLIDVLIDGFEKNEIFDGFHWRDLPMPSEEAARKKFTALCDEARRWKGTPTREQDQAPRRIAAWPDLEIRQVGRGILVRARAPWFDSWWHEKTTWQDDPIGAIRDWLEEERTTRQPDQPRP
jgi:hypothetical protein